MGSFSERELEERVQAEVEERLKALTKASAEREAAFLKESENDRRRLASMTVDLERARLGAQEAARASLESSRKAVSEAQAEAALILRRFKAELDERVAALLKTVENDRVRLEEMASELQEARRAAHEATRALREYERESLQKISKLKGQAAKREHALAKEIAEREALLLKSAVNERRLLTGSVEELEKEADIDRRHLEALGREFEETTRAMRESHQKEQDAARERLAMLLKASSERETLLLDKLRTESRRAAAMEVELEWTRRAAQKAEQAFREFHGISLTTAQAEAAERAAQRADAADSAPRP